jgi:hypothetical protein
MSPRRRAIIQLLVTVVVVSFAGFITAAEPVVDLTRAVIVIPSELTGPETKAVAMLAEEVSKRTQLTWRHVEAWPRESVPVIAVGQRSALQKLQSASPSVDTDLKTKPEGYLIDVDQSKSAPIVWVAGNDARGVLFGVGRLLRSLTMEKRKVTLPANFKVETAPHYRLRGHQLGYRPKTNSYDGWNLAQWEQYIRDLIIFGANSVELIPPRSDDDDESPHFPLPKMQMMVGVSKLCADYGLDVWIWYPAMDRDYSNPKTVEFALKEWGDVFKKLPRIDAVFVPGGDPGHTQPRYLMALLEKQTESLHRYHPKAAMWVSPQAFTKQWLQEFYDILAKEPTWLTGVVHGPQVRASVEQLRAAVPKKYPIRNYPDITHSRTCQFPVRDWDQAFALTEAREVINPRPLDEARIFHLLQKYTCGFLTYSEGCNDDVNKAVWSALGWDPEGSVLETLRDYSRYFIGPAYTDDFAQGLLALERNWVGPALTNTGIITTLQQFQDMEKKASPQVRQNWRFQEALYRAYYDAFVRSRLIYETQLEEEAMASLRRAPRTGSIKAVDEAQEILDRAVTQPPAQDLRARVFELGEALFQSIHMQLSVERYQGDEGRGTNLDTIDFPLNNRPWLRARFAEIRDTIPEAERLRLINEIVNWTNPGPGGFYDDLGNPSCQPHLLTDPGFDADPGYMTIPVTRFEDRLSGRKSWRDQAMTHYDAPLRMRYTGLDPKAQYKIRAVYADGPVRLVAGDKTEIHPLLLKPYERVEFDLPREATASGTLNLRWYGKNSYSGAGRYCQVAEVWLVKK